MANKNLTNAKKAKNDEFYTRYRDIQEEIEGSGLLIGSEVVFALSKNRDAFGNQVHALDFTFNQVERFFSCTVF